MAAALATAARAQLVKDGATNTLSNVTNTFTGDVTVGNNGAFTLLVLSNNTLLTNSANGLIGRNTTAKSNEVSLISATARWRMGGSLFVVSNGALVEYFNGTLGSRADSSNNFALVTGSGSMWSNRLDLNVGFSGPGNQLVLSNGALVANRTGNLGSQPGSSNNVVVVTGNGSYWSNQLDLNVGVDGQGNRLVIVAGGLVNCDNGRVGAGTFGSSSEALVTGPGSLWSSRSDFAVGLNPNFGVRVEVVNATGFFDSFAGLPPTIMDPSAWGDYDNDGRLDVVLPVGGVYRNSVAGFAIGAGLPGVNGQRGGSVVLGDYDNDGRIDVLLAGNGNVAPFVLVLRNPGGGFTNIQTGLTQTADSSAAWGDYDNDGRLDILLTGTTNLFYPFNQVPFTQVWRNTGSGFTNIEQSFQTGTQEISPRLRSSASVARSISQSASGFVTSSSSAHTA